MSKKQRLSIKDLAPDARRIIEAVIEKQVDHDTANGLRGVTRQQAMEGYRVLIEKGLLTVVRHDNGDFGIEQLAPPAGDVGGGILPGLPGGSQMKH